MEPPYKFFYRIGFHPWEDAEEQAEFVESFSRLVEEEEAGRQPSYGPALDVGTGSGIWAIKLVHRGWDVTGIDISDKALDRARERARDAGVELELVEGDVTDLRSLNGAPGFRLVLDTGTFHGLQRHQREAVGREVNRIAADDATVLLLAWTPRRRGPFPHGVSPGEIGEAFPGWTLTDEGPTGFRAPGPIEALMKPDEHWYRLRRN